MKTGTTLVTTLFALASFPLVAQQPPPDSQPKDPPEPPHPAEPCGRGTRFAEQSGREFASTCD